MIPVQNPLHAVQRNQPFAVPGAAHHHRGILDRRQIECVQRLVILQHHEIGNIHHVADGTQPGAGKPFLQPLRRRPDTHPVNHRCGIAAAQIGVGDRNADPFRRRRPRLPVTGSRLRHPPPGKGGHFVGHAQHREAIQAVGGKLQIQNRIAQVIRQRRPQRRIIGQDHNPRMILADTQL